MIQKIINLFKDDTVYDYVIVIWVDQLFNNGFDTKNFSGTYEEAEVAAKLFAFRFNTPYYLIIPLNK